MLEPSHLMHSLIFFDQSKAWLVVIITLVVAVIIMKSLVRGRWGECDSSATLRVLVGRPRPHVAPRSVEGCVKFVGTRERSDIIVTGMQWMCGGC